jgi:hypothetical protein
VGSTREAGGEAAANRIGNVCEHDRNCRCLAGKGAGHGRITPSPSACALNWKTCLSHALDTAFEIIGVLIWQDTPLPLD